jgi:hypothetical protein
LENLLGLLELHLLLGIKNHLEIVCCKNLFLLLLFACC